MGSILVDRKKNITSVHLRTGRMDSAYAAGMASSSTTRVEPMLADSELSSGGQAGAPVPTPKKSAYPENVSGAPRAGGLVPALASLCSEVSTIHSTGSTNRMPTTQASTPHSPPARRRTVGARRTAAVGVDT